MNTKEPKGDAEHKVQNFESRILILWNFYAKGQLHCKTFLL